MINDVTAKIKYDDDSIGTIILDGEGCYQMDNLKPKPVKYIQDLMKIIAEIKVWLNANGGVALQVIEDGE